MNTPSDQAKRAAEATVASERAELVKQVGECCMGSDPMCAAGCLVEKALRRRAGLEADDKKVIDSLTEQLAQCRADSMWTWIEKHRPLIERQAIGQWRVCTPVGCYEADTLLAALNAAKEEG